MWRPYSDASLSFCFFFFFFFLALSTCRTQQLVTQTVDKVSYRSFNLPTTSILKGTACWSLNSKLTHLCGRLRPLLFRLRGCTALPRLLQFCPLLFLFLLLLFLHVLCRRRARRRSFAVAVCRLPLPLQSTKVKYSSANTTSEKVVAVTKTALTAAFCPPPHEGELEHFGLRQTSRQLAKISFRY